MEVLSEMRDILNKGRYKQIPQLTSSQPMDVTQPFCLAPPTGYGTKRAVLIGINYSNHKTGQLKGCHNDCLNMKAYIMKHCGFDEDNIIVLLDDGDHPDPTRANILEAYRTMARVSRSGDAVFCHYSGKCFSKSTPTYKEWQ